MHCLSWLSCLCVLLPKNFPLLFEVCPYLQIVLFLITWSSSLWSTLPVTFPMSLVQFAKPIIVPSYYVKGYEREKVLMDQTQAMRMSSYPEPSYILNVPGEEE